MLIDDAIACSAIGAGVALVAVGAGSGVREYLRTRAARTFDGHVADVIDLAARRPAAGPVPSSKERA